MNPVPQAPVPLISSPCNAAVMNTVGPSVLGRAAHAWEYERIAATVAGSHVAGRTSADLARFHLRVTPLRSAIPLASFHSMVVSRVRLPFGAVF